MMDDPYQNLAERIKLLQTLYHSKKIELDDRMINEQLIALDANKMASQINEALKDRFNTLAEIGKLIDNYSSDFANLDKNMADYIPVMKDVNRFCREIKERLQSL
jgi:hypothetical protein